MIISNKPENDILQEKHAYLSKKIDFSTA
jgi:hypothetical protein